MFNYQAKVFNYQAKVFNVVDGDTLDVTIDLGFRITLEQRIRLYGVNTPERGQPGWAEASAMLTGLVLDQTVSAVTVKPHDKYGRWLATIITANGVDVAQALIDAGLGKPYFGTGPK